MRSRQSRRSKHLGNYILLGWRVGRAFAVLVFFVVVCRQNHWLFRQVIVVVFLGVRVVVFVVVVLSEACRKAQVIALAMVPIEIVIVEGTIGKMASTVGTFAVEFAF